MEGAHAHVTRGGTRCSGPLHTPGGLALVQARPGSMIQGGPGDPGGAGGSGVLGFMRFRGFRGFRGDPGSWGLWGFRGLWGIPGTGPGFNEGLGFMRHPGSRSWVQRGAGVYGVSLGDPGSVSGSWHLLWVGGSVFLPHPPRAECGCSCAPVLLSPACLPACLPAAVREALMSAVARGRQRVRRLLVGRGGA